MYYAAKPVTVDVPALLIRINRLYRHNMTPEELYEATRGVWKLGSRCTKAQFAFAVFEGVVREVYEIDSWHPAATTPYVTREAPKLTTNGRREFLDHVADATVRNRFFGHVAEAEGDEEHPRRRAAVRGQRQRDAGDRQEADLHGASRCSAADHLPTSAAALTLFFRGTRAPKRETSCAFAAVPLQVFASETVYVAWCDVPSTGTTGLRIMFSRSTDGGVTWSTPLTIAPGYVHAPQVVVPYHTGRVFVMYARYTAGATRNNSIEMVRSLDAGITFSALPALTDTRMLGPGSDRINGSPGTVQARSVFQARYNPSVGIQVVWHGEDPNNTAQTDIHYAAYSSAWTRKNLTPSAPGDQWNPSFDFDTSRNAVVTWLDRRNDPSNFLYQPYYMKINTSGNQLQAPGPLDASASNPAHYLPTNIGICGDLVLDVYQRRPVGVGVAMRIRDKQRRHPRHPDHAIARAARLR